MNFAISELIPVNNEQRLNKVLACINSKLTDTDSIRVPIYWDMIEPEDGKYTAISYLNLFSKVNPKISIVGLLCYAGASWARPLVLTDKVKPDISRFSAYAAYCMKAFPNINSWEIWNESNSNQFWINSNPSDYAELVNAIAPIIHKENKKVIIGVVSGAEDSTFKFLSEVKQLVKEDLYDIVSFHPYRQPHSPLDKYFGRTLYDQIIDMKKLFNKEIWITEIGWPTDKYDGGIKSYVQRWYLFLTRIICKLYNIKLFCFTLMDNDTVSSQEDVFGYYDNNGKGK